VLGDSADFSSFATSLKTPEKFFHSIPPMMTMVKKVPAEKAASASDVRIDFLGAIEKGDLVS
jgi:hypothetical protein